MDDLVDWSMRTAERLVGPLGRRWLHVQAVGRLATKIGPAFGDQEQVLVASAYLHDIGYAEELVITGFHPLDGARYIRAQGLDQVALLVAHHSGARVEARLRGLVDFEREFPFGRSALDDALTFCDLTTSPDGKSVTLDDRIDEIAERYGPNSPTAAAILGERADFHRARNMTLARVEAAGLIT